MPSAPISRGSPLEVPPARADLRELAAARQVIAALAHPDTRHIVDTALGTLHAALSGGGLQVSKITGLQHAVRKHVRQAWTDGVIAPLARSRDPADRAVLAALPQAVALSAHAEAVTALERIGRGVPEGAAGTRDHVARAGAYLRTLPLVLQALTDLEAAVPPAARAPDDVGTGVAGAAAVARRRLKAALARGLPALVEGLAEAVYRGPLPASDAPALRMTAAALRAPPARGARRSDRGAAQWRQALAAAVSRDLVDHALAPAAGRLLGRHAGLEIGDASYVGAADHQGRLDLGISRGAVRLVLSVRFDIGAGQIEPSVAAVDPGGDHTPLDHDAVDALLDAAVPDALDTPAHRAMRHLSRWREPPALRMAVAGDEDLEVAAHAPGRQDAGLIAELVRIADAEGVTLRVAVGRDMALAAGLIEVDFEWREDPDGRHLVRAPAGDPPRPGR